MTDGGGRSEQNPHRRVEGTYLTSEVLSAGRTEKGVTWVPMGRGEPKVTVPSQTTVLRR